MDCPCGSGQSYDQCCQPVIAGTAPAATPEALMRARYSAFVTEEIDFLRQSLHPEHREDHDPDAVRDWARESHWQGLEILATEGGGPGDDTGRVEFACEYTLEEEFHRHHEDARFARHDGRWYFVDGEAVVPRPYRRQAPKVGRNDPCPCGSGKKFKKCCGRA
jgi:SEC-C motif-containing protein